MTAITEPTERGAALLDEAACEAICDFFGAEWVCGKPATGLFRRACIHEHVRDGWLCRDHVENPHGHCRACWDLPAEMSHDCPITLAEVAA